MTTDRPFGEWLRQRRRVLDLTQEELARQVGCSAITLRKLEAEERRPSKQIAERLADVLHVLPDDRPAFLRFSRGDPFAAPDTSPVAVLPIHQPEQPKAPPHNLPLQLTSFIGREKEIAEVRQLLTRARLVTLTGAGGSGKTRLALEVASGVLDASVFGDGVWLVELAPLVDPALVLQTAASALEVREAPGRPLVDTLLDHLRPKRLMLVLDNCEHLVGACAELVERLLRACAHLTVLATSREGLGIPGESVYPVPVLSLPEAGQTESVKTVAQSEAVRLLVERVNAVLPSFELTRDNAAAVAQVCWQLDGLPLAIELAAARVKVLGVEQIGARLTDRFALLRGGSRTALPRHQTLQGLIDWSYGLLSEPERALLQGLAVFAGGWTLEAAEAVAVDGSSGEAAVSALTKSAVLDLLTQLASKSLVVVDQPPSGAPRYRLLETIRQYALAKLAERGEEDTVRQRHAAYFLTVAAARELYPRAAWLDRMEQEHDNLRAALAWSQSPQGNSEIALSLVRSVDHFWYGNGYYSEGRPWMEGALILADAGHNLEAKAELLFVMANFAASQSDYAASQAYFADAIGLSPRLGEVQKRASGLKSRGWLARERGDANTARVLLMENLTLTRELGDKVEIADALMTLGEVAVMLGDTTWATTLIEEGLAVSRELGDDNFIGWGLNHLGHVAQVQGEFQRATRLHEESLPPFRRMGPKFSGVAWAYQGLGEAALAQNDAALATTHFTKSLVLFRDQGGWAGQSWCLAGLAGVAVLDEEPERAARLWGAAEALRQAIGCRPPPAARATHERLMAAARKQLGDAAFDAEWAEGQKLTMEQAVALALTAAGS